MLTQEIGTASHAGEGQSSVEAVDRRFSVFSYHGVYSLAKLVGCRPYLKAGDVIYVAEIRRHVLTNAELAAAAGTAIDGAA
jgi:hypothetical protein